MTQAPPTPARWASYADIALGAEFTSKGRTITDADILLFTALTTGFHQPLHTDLEWVKANTSFPERLLPGPAILAYSIGQLSATLVYSDATVAFAGLERVRAQIPICAGDTITATATVTTRRLTSKGDRGIIELAVVVTNQRGDTAMTYAYNLMVRAAPQGGASTNG